MSTFPTVVFDLDDTLYLERDYALSGFQEVAAFLEKKFQLQNVYSYLENLFQQNVRGNTFDLLIQNYSLQTKITVAELVQVYRSHKPQIKLLQDSESCIRVLRQKTKLGLITDGPANSQRNKINALQLPKWFQHIIVTDEYGPGFSKPHPRSFEEIQKNLPGPWVYVADNPEKDFQTPYKFGWKTVRIRRKEGLHFHKDNLGPVDFEITDLNELLHKLEEIR